MIDGQISESSFKELREKYASQLESSKSEYKEFLKHKKRKEKEAERRDEDMRVDGLKSQIKNLENRLEALTSDEEENDIRFKIGKIPSDEYESNKISLKKEISEIEEELSNKKRELVEGRS